MNKFALISISTLLLAQTANASITHSLVQSSPAGLPPGVFAWDLRVTVSGDDWTSTDLNATAFVGSFQNPNPLNIYNPGVNDADTWFDATFGDPSFAGGPIITSTSISATWFRIPPNGGDGTFTIARILATSNAEFQISGASSTYNGGAQLTTYSFYVPSPSALTVLAGAACVGRRRRR